MKTTNMNEDTSKIEIYKLADGQSDIRVQFDKDSVWLSRSLTIFRTVRS